MKKKICYAVICSMLLAASMTGCGGKDSGTTAAKTEASTQAGTEAPDKNDAPAATEAASSTGLAAAAKVSFNGVTFGTGDKASEVVAKLGDQVKPSDSSQPCIPGAGELTRYYYKGMTITASQYDVISNINFSNENGEGDDAKTADGIGLGSTADEIKAAIGTPASEDEFGLSYSEGTLSLTVVFDDEGKVMSLSIEDMSVEL